MTFNRRGDNDAVVHTSHRAALSLAKEGALQPVTAQVGPEDVSKSCSMTLRNDTFRLKASCYLIKHHCRRWSPHHRTTVQAQGGFFPSPELRAKTTDRPRRGTRIQSLPAKCQDEDTGEGGSLQRLSGRQNPTSQQVRPPSHRSVEV